MAKLNIAHLDFIHRWSRYINHIDLTAILKNNSFTNIAIYGGGGVGELLFEYLYGTDINVKCIIDINEDLNFPYDVEVITPKKFVELNIDVDSIFITPFDFEDIIAYLKPFVNYPLIPLNLFVVDIDGLRYLSDVERHLEKYNIHLYMLDITWPLSIYIKNPSEKEQLSFIHKSLAKNFNLEIKSNINLLRDFYDDLPQCDDEYIKQVFPTIRIIEKDGIRYREDIESKYKNIISGVRLTTDVPKKYDNTIHFFGPCYAAGIQGKRIKCQK